MGKSWQDPGVTRRQFLRLFGTAAGLGAAATLAPLRALAAIPNPAQPLRVVIVGAGLAGLCAAYELKRRGHEVVVLEASPNHVGGRARTHRFGDGLYGELGAMRIPQRHELTRHYVAEFGLSLRPFVQSNPEAYYYVRGHKVRIRDEARVNPYYALADGEKTKSPGDLWAQTVLAALDSLSSEERADLRSTVFQTTRVRELDQLSLEAVLKQGGLSPEAVEFLAVLWAYETSLGTGIIELLREENEETWTLAFDEIVGGTDRLPRAFAERLGDVIRMNAKVIRIEQDALKGKAAAVYLHHGTEYRVEGDVLLCTLPLGVLSHVAIEPGLSGPKNRAIRQVTYDSSTKVLAVASRRFWETDDGIYGGGTYTDLPSAITYYPADNAQAKDPAVSRRPSVFLASYTWGQPARHLAAVPHRERAKIVIENLAKVHPQLAQPGTVQRTVSWSWDQNPFSRGAFCWFSPGQHETLYRHLIEPEGRLFFAGEHASLTHSWMQGALESALRAVQQILTIPV